MPNAEKTVGDARGAVKEPEAETHARAEGEVARQLDERPPPSSKILELCEEIRRVIREKRPPDEESLVKAKPRDMAREAGDALKTNVRADTEGVQGQYDSLEQPPQGQPASQPRPYEQPKLTVEVPEIGAAGAAPDPIPEENVSLGPDVASQQARMAEAGMDTEPAKLVQDGPIAEARAAHGELAQMSAQDPVLVLQQQQQALQNAQGNMAELQARALEALSSARTNAIGGRTQQQGRMVGSEEQMRAVAGKRMRERFARAQGEVKKLLDPLPQTAMKKWQIGVELASLEFETTLRKVEDWIEQRHAGFVGKIRAAGDWLLGLPGWVVEEYDRAEKLFGDTVCELISDISRDVNAVVAACEAIIEAARSEIDAIVNSLPAELQEWAAGEADGVNAQLDGLRAQVHEARDSFERDLAERASGAVQEVRERVHSLREAAGGLVGRISAAISEFLEDPARFIINGLLTLLGIPPASFWAVVDRLGDVISGIADDPLGFAGNLLEALAQGFTQFFDNIAAHLLQGLLDWLFSKMSSVGVQLPTDLSLGSVVTFFLQLMGLTWDNIREILSRHIGEDNVALLEQAFEIISVLVEQGPRGIFEMIKDQLDPAVILDAVMDAAISMVVEALITQATVRILAMLNPAGAILQAIEAIYRVLRWVFENAAQIFSLVETIVNGAWDIMNGNIGGMASAVERSLAGLLPPVIDFLASYVGLSDLPERIAEVIRGLQEWVLGLVDRVVGFIVGQARRLLAALGLGGEEDNAVGDAVDDLEHRFHDEDGEGHVMRIRFAEALPRITVASAVETSVPERIQARKDADAALTPEQVAALDRAAEQNEALQETSRRYAAAAAEERGALEAGIRQIEARLAVELVLGDAWVGPVPPTHVSFSPKRDAFGVRGEHVHAEPLTRTAGNTTGSAAADVLTGWNHPTGGVPPQTAGRGSSQPWRRVHLLPADLHGPGNEPANLVPGDSSTNGLLEHGPEKAGVEGIEAGHVLAYDARVNGWDSSRPFFPSGITVHVELISSAGRRSVWGPRTVPTAGAPTDSSAPMLSSTEQEVVAVAERLDTTVRQTIADEMGITPQAVSLAVGRIRVKITNMLEAGIELTPALENAQDVLGL